MDANRFDALARVIVARTTRRVAVGLAVSGLLGVAVPDAEAARCSKTRPCPACKRCKRQRCRKDVTQNGTGCTGGTCQNGVCTAECSSAQDCTGTDTDCRTRTCSNGTCGTSFTAAGVAITAQTAGDCKKTVCDGAGGFHEVPDSTDLPNDGNPCTDDLCTAGVPSHPDKHDGEICNTTGSCFRGQCSV
jgi:hypothetical protein